MNFQQSPCRPRKTAGWLLLLAGVALLIEMSVSYGRLQNDRKITNEKLLASSIRSDTYRNDSSYRFTDKDFAEARQIINRISVPWSAFFVGLESADNPNVAILTIQPDIKAGLLRMEGEAKDYAAVLTLIARLRVTKPFSGVFLLRHEIKRDDPHHPVAFALSMNWGKPL